MENSLDKLAPALVAFQADRVPVAKTAVNPFFKSKYADLPEVMQTAQPLLAKHKLAVSQFPTHLDGVSALRTILLHESGQFIEDVTPILLTKQDAQSQGSAITYAKRYGYMAVLGLVADEDDDGNRAALQTQPPIYKSTNSAPNAAGSTRVASEKQRSMIAALAHQKGKDNDWIDNVMTRAMSTSDASAIIDKLQALEDAQ
jgi:hypothetical protein